MSAKECSVNTNYLIYDDGRVYSKLSKSFKSTSISNGYYAVSLQRKVYRVHRLVALEFVLNPNRYNMVNHIDHNKLNNHYTNLEWTSESENTKHSLKVNKPNQTSPVVQYSIDNVFVKEYESIKKASDLTGSSADMISHCCRGTQYVKSVIGGDNVYYKWRYKDEKLKQDIPKEGKEIKGFENYLITSNGKVYSKCSKRYINLCENKDGYLRVNLYDKEKKKWFSIHRLVAEYFIGDTPDVNSQVNHKDFNKSNNHVDNLEWCSPQENNQHSATKKGKRLKLTHIENGNIMFFDNTKLAAKYLGLTCGFIANCCRGVKKSAKGYKCEYV